MKSYKLVNSREVQEKAERLGYKWNMSNNEDKFEKLEEVFLILDSDIMIILNDVDLNDYNRSSFQEITQKDFLALPEPIKVGDWCKSEIGGWLRIFKVESIDGNMYKNNTAGIGFFKNENCTKLTPEQIDILELED